MSSPVWVLKWACKDFSFGKTLPQYLHFMGLGDVEPSRMRVFKRSALGRPLLVSPGDDTLFSTLELPLFAGPLSTLLIAFALKTFVGVTSTSLSLKVDNLFLLGVRYIFLDNLVCGHHIHSTNANQNNEQRSKMSLQNGGNPKVSGRDLKLRMSKT